MTTTDGNSLDDRARRSLRPVMRPLLRPLAFIALATLGLAACQEGGCDRRGGADPARAADHGGGNGGI